MVLPANRLFDLHGIFGPRKTGVDKNRFPKTTFQPGGWNGLLLGQPRAGAGQHPEAVPGLRASDQGRVLPLESTLRVLWTLCFWGRPFQSHKQFRLFSGSRPFPFWFEHIRKQSLVKHHLLGCQSFSTFPFGLMLSGWTYKESLKLSLRFLPQVKASE